MGNLVRTGMVQLDRGGAVHLDVEQVGGRAERTAPAADLFAGDEYAPPECRVARAGWVGDAVRFCIRTERNDFDGADVRREAVEECGIQRRTREDTERRGAFA